MMDSERATEDAMCRLGSTIGWHRLETRPRRRGASKTMPAYQTIGTLSGDAWGRPRRAGDTLQKE